MLACACASARADGDAGVADPAIDGAPVPKRVAIEVARRLTTYEPGSSARTIAGSVAGDVGRRRAALARAARPLFDPGSSSDGTVRYAQLGGRRPGYVAVMVVVRQRFGRRVQTRTLDVRIRHTEGTWVFDELASAGGTPVRRPRFVSDDAAAEDAAAVLDDPRITLSDSARWDIHRGVASPGLLRVLRALAQRTSFAVSAIAVGHPDVVIASGRPSTHALGLAADVYRIGGEDVSDRSALARAALRFIAGRPEAAHVGGPWDLGPRTFTDPVHQDHIHIGVAY